MKRYLLAVLIAAPILIAGVHAFAGKKTTRNVKITSNSGFFIATGGVRAARASSDGKQQIGCTLIGLFGGPSDVECFAVDSAGREFGCFAGGTPEMLAALSAINTTSDLTLVADSGGTCAEIDVRNESTNL
jgi:hypothetical protein